MATGESATILHVDMDAFFAAVEILQRPELEGRAAVVARNSERSVVTSATYEARRFGVHSAMPLTRALRLCPHAVVLEPHMEKYRAVSDRVMALFRDVTPLVEPVSIDEAFLDVSGARRLLGPPPAIARGIRRRVREKTGLPCSVGAAATKFVAKLASGRAKPDGLLVIEADETLDYLRPLPVGALWGVGEKTREALERRGIRTVGELAETPRTVVERAVGAAHGALLHDLAHGIDPRTVESHRREKSIGHETTFERDETDPARLRTELLRLCIRTAARLRALGLAGQTITLKLRYADFRTVTRSRTLGEPTDVGRRIYDQASRALEEARAAAPVRLVGVRVEQLGATGSAAALWDPDEDWRGAEHAMDAVGRRFGRDALGPAALLGERPRPLGDTSRPGRDR